MFFLDDKDLPGNFSYPPEFKRIINQGLTDLDPWGIMQQPMLKERYLGMKSRYPDRHIIPFARRWDNDDVACFDLDKGGLVCIVHDFASPGWEARKFSGSIWDWFKIAVDDMIEYDSPEN